MSDFTVDAAGWVYYDEFRLPLKIDFEKRVVEFIDKDRRRSEERGTRFVEIPASSIADLFSQAANNDSVNMLLDD